MSHSPLFGHVDPEQSVLEEVNTIIKAARQRIASFAPDLVILFVSDHYNGFFYDVMPSFCVGMAAHTIGDFGTLAGPLLVPQDLAESCAEAVLESGVDSAVSYRMQLDHGAAQPLVFLLGGLREAPVIPIFINSVATPLPSFQRARLLGEAIGQWARLLNRRVLFLGSGGLSHQPPVPELVKIDGLMADRLKGSGRHLPADEREARTQRVINAAKIFTQDQSSLHPLNPEWDQFFLSMLERGDLLALDSIINQELSDRAGKSTHEIKAWVAAFAALSSFGAYQATDKYYRPIPEWIAGFGSLSAQSVSNNESY